MIPAQKKKLEFTINQSHEAQSGQPGFVRQERPLLHVALPLWAGGLLMGSLGKQADSVCWTGRTSGNAAWRSGLFQIPGGPHSLPSQNVTHPF